MNRTEAIKILERQIAELKTWSYTRFAEWQQRKHFEVFEVKSETGNYYRIEAQALLKNSHDPSNQIRVVASIDNSHLLSINTGAPLTKSFVITSNNEIIEE